MKYLFPALLLTGALLADGPVFEAASVKLAPPDAHQPYGFSGGPGTVDPGRFHANRVRLSLLLTRAFGVPIDQISGPAWLLEFPPKHFYDITASVPPRTTDDQFRQMLQNLLAERFHLVYHRETRSFPGYALVVDKSGPRIHEVAPDPHPIGEAQAVIGAPRDGDGFPVVPGPRVMSRGGADGRINAKYQEQTMAKFAANLGFTIGSSQGRGASQGFAQPRVIDRTGLPGVYTFILRYASAANLSPDSIPADPPGADYPDILVALRTQLGLRLDKIPAVPAEVIVIEKLDQLPTEN